MSAKYKSPSFLLPNELNTSANTANDTGVNSLYSMNFDGTNNIDCGNISALNGATQATWSCWYKKTATGAPYFMGTWGGASARLFLPYQFSQGTGAIMYVYMGSSTGSSRLMFQNATNCVINLNTWYHMAFVYNESESSNSDKLKFYLDGTELPNETTGFALTSLNTVTASFNIGGPTTLQRFTGNLDEVAIFNRALNSTERAALYEGTSPNIYPSNLIASNLNPLAYYPLGEQAQNTGYLDPNNPGSDISGSEWQFPNGVLQDYVMDFDGVNDFVDLGDLQPSTTSLSISAWAYKTDASNASIIGRGASVDYGIFVYSGNLHFGINVGGWTTISTTLPVNQWFHVLATWNGSIMKLSVNGGTPVTTSKTGTITYTSNNTTIGKNSTLSGFEWDGKISNVAIWNSDQSANIADIYNNGSPQTSYTVSPQNWWKLNADSVYTPSVPNYTKALDFNGSSNYIDTPQINLGSTNTISFWINNSATNIGTIFGDPNTYNTTYALSWSTTANILSFRLGNGNNGYWQLTVSSGLLSDGNWHHHCLSRNGVTINYYIDGTLQTNVTNNTLNASAGTNTTIENIMARSNGTSFASGELSNVSLYNTALTGPQVSTLFNFGTPETAISFSPISWWKLDNTTTGLLDSGSASNNGTNSNPGATQTTTSVAVVPSWKIPDASGTVNGVSTTLPSTALQQSDLQFDSPYSNYSLSFDGINDAINISNNSVFNLGTSFTISGWFNVTSYVSNMGYISFDSSTRGWFLFHQNTNLALYDGTSVTTLNSNLQPTNEWNSYIITYDGTDLIFYLNGQQNSTQSVSINLQTNGNDGQIGNQQFAAGRFYNGKIDETALWSTALTSAQVLEIYNNGRPKDLTTFSGTAPISWWRLGENAYFQDSTLVLPNSITGAPNGNAATNNLEMISADAPGTYANGIGENLDILDRVGDAPLSVANSQSYNMIPSDISPYVPQYVGDQIANTASMTFNGVDSFFDIGNVDLGINSTLSMWFKPGTNPTVNDYALIGEGSNGFDYVIRKQSGSFYVWVGSSFHNYGSVIANNINVGGWNFLAIQKVGDTITVYLKNTNGEFEATATISGWATTSMTFDRIGARTISPVAQTFSGQIDEVAGFSEALTPDQIKFDLYEPSLPLSSNKTADIANNPNLPNPVAWYRMGD